ncbi:hypothetical protein PR202_gb05916 [Eleusine coracana subsp. coracana]|uniref:Uncharacterized protein n=1 Tax=Eleusine coracana subsp. coracana TaxID=191504 RepID=A0AAV5E7J4_ELECO|nr:hypothetical protein PR202_gb05916 [Eleusine coracana subsp. coracana]
MMAIDDIVMTRMLAHATVVTQLRPQTDKGDHQRQLMMRSMASRLMSLGFVLLDGRKDSSRFPSKNMMDKPIPKSGYNSIARRSGRLEVIPT